MIIKTGAETQLEIIEVKFEEEVFEKIREKTFEFFLRCMLPNAEQGTRREYRQVSECGHIAEFKWG